MKPITMYSKRVCPYCVAAEKLLLSLGHPISEKILIDEQPERRDEMIQKTGRMTVPQIFVGDTLVGGYDDLSAMVKSGAFKELIA